MGSLSMIQRKRDPLFLLSSTYSSSEASSLQPPQTASISSGVFWTILAKRRGFTGRTATSSSKKGWPVCSRIDRKTDSEGKQTTPSTAAAVHRDPQLT